MSCCLAGERTHTTSIQIYESLLRQVQSHHTTGPVWSPIAGTLDAALICFVAQGRGHLACSVHSSFLPNHQVHFVPAFLEFQVAGIPQLPQGIGWLFLTFQIFIRPIACPHRTTWTLNFISSSFLFLLISLGCFLHRTELRPNLRSFQSKSGHRANPEFHRQTFPVRQRRGEFVQVDHCLSIRTTRPTTSREMRGHLVTFMSLFFFFNSKS